MFWDEWCCRYGIPSVVITDQGTQFESRLFNALLEYIGTQRRRTTAYHPQTNGMIERMHYTLKTMITCVIEDYVKSMGHSLTDCTLMR